MDKAEEAWQAHITCEGDVCTVQVQRWDGFRVEMPVLRRDVGKVTQAMFTPGMQVGYDEDPYLLDNLKAELETTQKNLELARKRLADTEGKHTHLDTDRHHWAAVEIEFCLVAIDSLTKQIKEIEDGHTT